MYPEKITPLGGFFLAPGYSTEYIHLYLAQKLSPRPLEQDEDEDIQLEKIHLEELMDHLMKGKFQDAKTLASLFIAFRHLDKLKWT
jgi:ADP-ribose pyrophosphatase